VVSFGGSTFNSMETQGTATISVMLSAASPQVVTVDYSTSNGTAFVGFDYVASTGSLTFPPGQVSQTFDVPVIDDNVDDPDMETVRLTLSNPSGNATFGSNQAQLTISDDDPEPGLSFQSTTFSTNESVTPGLTISLTHPSGKLISVNYGPNGGGSATAGVDYNATAFSFVAFGPALTGVGPTSVSFQWTGGIIDDNTLEIPDETVELELFTASNAVLTNPVTTTLTILNDD
jgi:hypothetical protein